MYRLIVIMFSKEDNIPYVHFVSEPLEQLLVETLKDLLEVSFPNNIKKITIEEIEE